MGEKYGFSIDSLITHLMEKGEEGVFGRFSLVLGYMLLVAYLTLLIVTLPVAYYSVAQGDLEVLVNFLIMSSLSLVLMFVVITLAVAKSARNLRLRSVGKVKSDNRWEPVETTMVMLLPYSILATIYVVYEYFRLKETQGFEGYFDFFSKPEGLGFGTLYYVIAAGFVVILSVQVSQLYIGYGRILFRHLLSSVYGVRRLDKTYNEELESDGYELDVVGYTWSDIAEQFVSKRIEKVETKDTEVEFISRIDVGKLVRKMWEYDLRLDILTGRVYVSEVAIKDEEFAEDVRLVLNGYFRSDKLKGTNEDIGKITYYNTEFSKLQLRDFVSKTGYKLTIGQVGNTRVIVDKLEDEMNPTGKGLYKVSVREGKQVKKALITGRLYDERKDYWKGYRDSEVDITSSFVLTVVNGGNDEDIYQGGKINVVLLNEDKIISYGFITRLEIFKGVLQRKSKTFEHELIVKFLDNKDNLLKLEKTLQDEKGREDTKKEVLI